MIKPEVRAHIVSMHETLLLTAEVIARNLQLPKADVQRVMDQHDKEVEDWILANDPKLAEVGCEFDGCLA